MSKQNIKKFRKNDYYEDVEIDTRNSKVNKRKEKRFDRALKTKDVHVLLEVEEEESVDDYFYNKEFDEYLEELGIKKK